MHNRTLLGTASGVLLLAVVGLSVLLARATREDFGTYYAAGLAAREHQSVYTDALAWRDANFTVNLPAPPPTEGSPYVYPPVFSLLMVPLTLIGPAAASLLWYVGIVASLAASMWMLTRLLFPLEAVRQVPLALALTLLAMLFGPVRTNLAAGQTDVLLLLLIVASFATFARGRLAQAGMLLALGVAIKPTVVFLALFFLWKRAYRSFATFAVGGALLLIIPTLYFGLQSVFDFVAVGQYWSSAAFSITPTNQSPYAMLLRLFTVNGFTQPIADASGLVAIARYAIPILAVVVLLLNVGRTRQVPIRRLTMEFGLVILAMLIAGPVSEDNHFTFLLLPILAAGSTLLCLKLSPPTRLVAGLGLAATVVYLSWPTLRLIRNAYYSYYTASLTGPEVFLTGAFLYGLLALCAIALLVSRRWRATS